MMIGLMRRMRLVGWLLALFNKVGGFSDWWGVGSLVCIVPRRVGEGRGMLHFGLCEKVKEAYVCTINHSLRYFLKNSNSCIRLI